MNIFCTHDPVRVDGDTGPGVCSKCGTPLGSNVLTEDALLHGMEAIRRAPHTMDCVQVERNEWLCSASCPARHL